MRSLVTIGAIRNLLGPRNHPCRSMLGWVILACGLGSASDAIAETQVFDVEGYLAECTARVPSVPTHVPMDALCVSTSQRLCDIAYELRQTEACLLRVSAWLEGDLQTYADLTVPEFINPPLMELPSPQELCITQRLPNVSQAVLCRYAEALADWNKRRVVFHIQRGLNPNEQWSLQ